MISCSSMDARAEKGIAGGETEEDENWAVHTDKEE
jgi:hypothetical protein